MAAAVSSLKEYLKRYQSDGADDQTKKKKKKKKEKQLKSNPFGAGVLVVDEDPVWQKPVVIEEEESADDEVPVVDEDIEVKRMRRLEAVRARNQRISEDGSGWVSISVHPRPSGDSDLSPPRQRRPRFDTPSPDRERNMESSKDGDLSPPRQRRRRFYTPSPEREPRVRDSGEVDEDLSPLRRNWNRSPDVDPDLSPPRRNRNRSPEVNADLSLRRRSKKGSVDRVPPPRWVEQRLPKVSRRGKSPAVELSPPSRRKEPSLAVDEDLPPPRKMREASLAKDEDLSPPRKKREPSVAKETRRTGLLSAEEIRKENEKKRKEEVSRFASMDPSMSGRGAQPVFRDREGRRINKEELLKAQEEEKPKETKLEWGKGLAQKREAEDRAKELELEKEKPFARTRDDPELDKMLKERVRWGDPMAHLVKKNSEPVLEDLGSDEKMKESGFIIPQSIPNHSWIKRGIDFPPNRYDIRPGRHWDGVDRSNGYEKGLFKRQNEKRATETEAYLWSVADM